jgi:hypothetical protein
MKNKKLLGIILTIAIIASIVLALDPMQKTSSAYGEKQNGKKFQKVTRDTPDE